MKKLLTIILSAVAVISAARADNFVPQSPTEGMSPNARSFQCYGEIPVSLYTGTPSVSIPLATLRDGSLTLPIELSYHSGGIKADEHPGWTGLGWTLIAGGAITREKYDLPDELDDRGFFYKYSVINGLDKAPSKVYDLLASHEQSSVLAYDLQPDKFNFHFSGYSGFFIMDAKGVWHVCCDRPIKVESYTVTPPFNLDNKIFPAHNSKIISSFVLVGEDGTKYTFGIDAIDLSINIRRQASAAWEANAWYLKKIEHPNGDCFSYSYKREKFAVTFSNSAYYIYLSESNGTVSAASISEPEQGTLIYPVYLSGIEGSTFKASFSYSETTELRYPDSDFIKRLTVDFDDQASRPIYFTESDMKNHMSNVAWYKLDAIDLYSRGYRFKSISFDYSSSSTLRLMLNSLKMQGSDQKTYEQYSFRYHYPEKMPAYLSGETDHWGYYNGIKNDIDNPMTTNFTDPVKVRYGSLREISYPTGGKTVFEFEANTYSRVANTYTSGDLNEAEEESLAGGLRIKRIYNVPNDSSAVRVREFRYTRGYSASHPDSKSSGILECPPEYQIRTPYDRGAVMFECSESPLSNIINSYGFHIGYPEVAELDGSGGYTIHKFTSCAEPGYKDIAPMIQSGPSKFVPMSSKAASRGLPSYEGVYGSDGRLLRERYSSYSIPDGYEDYVHSLYCQINEIPIVGSHGGAVPYMSYSLYKIFTDKLRLLSTRELIYNGSSEPFTVHRYYKYNDYGQMSCDSAVTQRKGQKITDAVSYKYAWEKESSFKSGFLLSYPQVVTTRHNGKLISDIVTQYSFSGDAPYIADVARYTPGRQRQNLYACLYADKKGKPLLILNSDDILTAYLWGLDGLYPVASIVVPDILTYRTLVLLKIQIPDTDSGLHAMFAGLRDSLPGAMVTGYIYRPWLGVVSMTDPAGKKISYGYDPFGRLIEIKDNDGNTVTSYGYSTATCETVTASAP